MPITTDDYAYPFDPTGTAPTNKISDEVHVITQQNHKDYYFVIPKLAPFFGEGLTIYFTDATGIPVQLEEGADYYFGHHFLAASRAIGKQVYGSISFINKQFKGVMQLGYQTLGGKWTYDQAYLNQLMTNIVANPRISTWDSIVELPGLFPVIDHEWNLVDMVGMAEMVAGLYGIEEAIRDPEGTGTGGGSGSQLMSHILNKTNPHNVTKLQVGLGNVDNFETATLQDAASGSAVNKFMTAALVKYAIEQQVLNDYTAHESNHENPHVVTKAQVGLGNVGNFPVANPDEAASGVAADRYMTAKSTKEAIDAQVKNSFNAHAADETNPHNVTANQTGTYSATELDALFLEKLDKLAKAADTTLFDGKTVAEITALILSGKAYDTARVDGLNSIQLKAWILGGTADNSYRLDGKTYDEIVLDLQSNIVGDLNFANQVKHEALEEEVGATNNWTLISTIDYPDPELPGMAIHDGQYLIAGCDTRNDTKSTLYYLRIGIRGSDPIAVTANLFNFANVNVGASIGYVINADFRRVDVWVKTGNGRNVLSVTSLNKDGGDLVVNSNTPVIEEPIGISYIVETNQVADTVLFDGKTVAEVTSLILAGTAANAAKLGNQLPTFFATAEDLMTHIDATNNPHTVTKAQVGLGSVDNFGTSTQAEAIAGISNAKFMTPLRTKEAITSVAVTPLTTRLDATDANVSALMTDLTTLFNSFSV